LAAVLIAIAQMMSVTPGAMGRRLAVFPSVNRSRVSVREISDFSP
jgi:hypothetical protein